METTLKELFKFDRQLLGAGYDSALLYIDSLIGLDIIEIPSGTQLDTWTVPDEWIVKEAWVKNKGKKIMDYKKDPMSLMCYSAPFTGTIKRKEFLKHLVTNPDVPKATPYSFSFYERKWGICLPHSKKLPAGDYEVFIDTEFKPGTMKLGVHTIPGKLDKEILLFAHLDHPWQANDNLSAVTCLIDLAKKIKSDYTIKIVFCPETIGSMGYVKTQDLSKVEFMIAVDICGNDNEILLQQSWETKDRVNRVAHCALQAIGKPYRKARFRSSIGSDEYHFNDPKIGIPGLMLTTHPYKEYHTSFDTPQMIDYDKIQETQDLILKIIEIYEKDYIPERNFTGALMRSKYDIQSFNSQINLNYDYFFYSIDGKRSLAEICADYELPFELIYDVLGNLQNDGQISRIDFSEVGE